MSLTPPIEPMLAHARRQLPSANALPGGVVAEQKPDGFRAIVFARRDLVLVQSRQGTDLTSAFPDVARAARDLGHSLVLDGELVVPRQGRLDFAALQRRARRRGRSAEQAAAADPAYLIAFDVLESDGTNLMSLPYRDRRARLESLFANGGLDAPFTLCPATTDWATAQDWLDPAWGSAGIEGVVLKGLSQPYLPGKRAWIKVRNRRNCITCNTLRPGLCANHAGQRSGSTTVAESLIGVTCTQGSDASMLCQIQQKGDH
ncbi:hypothetical protein ACFY2V_24280 [Streptomyces eurythermus]|uniref:ATP-dependent DNA ligase n=1 Tax=Streptomyces eurythermus TaxID=42237 RepID=UPI00368ACC8D